MANLNQVFKNVSQQWTAESVSWGSLMLWVGGVTVLILMMMNFSQN